MMNVQQVSGRSAANLLPVEQHAGEELQVASIANGVTRGLLHKNEIERQENRSRQLKEYFDDAGSDAEYV
jgi:hypothetical protein